VTCKSCHGSGLPPGTKVRPCQHCKGEGTTSSSQGGPFHVYIQTPCGLCQGTGIDFTCLCSICRGRGVKITQEKTTVDVPSGTGPGSYILVRNKGHITPDGTSDLMIHINTPTASKDKKTWIENGVIHRMIPVSFTVLATGGEVETTDAIGTPVVVTIPKGLEAGEKLLLEGLGIRSTNPIISTTSERGNMILVPIPYIPNNLPEKALELLKELEPYLVPER